MTDKQAIKDFVDMMEQRTFRQGFASEMLESIKDSREFKALKASISPVSEDERETHVKQCPGCKVNLYRDVCECPYKIIDKPKALCMCADYEGSNFKCPLCESEKEPKKQTLLDYSGEFLNHITAQEISLLHLISKYLEEQNKCK